MFWTFLIAGLATVVANGVAPYPDCPDIHLNAICGKSCEDATYKCFLTCDSSDTNYCPCGVNCSEGCENCENDICQCSNLESNADWNNCIDINGASLGRCVNDCQNESECESSCLNVFKSRQLNCPCEENCSAGCPCDEWDCEHQTTTTSEVSTTALPEKSVLVLSNTNSRSVPMVVSFDGEVDNDIEFDYNEFVGYGCSTTLNGEFYYVGGGNDNKQVSKVEGCSFNRVGDLPFGCSWCACNTFTFDQEMIMFGFHMSGSKQSMGFDGEKFVEFPPTTHAHINIAKIGVYKANPFAVSGGNGVGKTEIMITRPEGSSWSDAADYPFAKSVDNYAVTSTSDSFYLIGGNAQDFDGSRYHSTVIARYNNDEWSLAGHLSVARYGHSAISFQDQTMIIGGYTDNYVDAPTEVWTPETGSLESKNPILDAGLLAYGIGLWIVDDGYCAKN